MVLLAVHRSAEYLYACDGACFVPCCNGVGHLSNVVPEKVEAGKFSVTLAILFLGIIRSASACAVCIGNPKSPMVRSMNDGVWLLLAVVGIVLVGFAGLFLFWRHRAKHYSL